MCYGIYEEFCNFMLFYVYGRGEVIDLEFCLVCASLVPAARFFFTAEPLKRTPLMDTCMTGPIRFLQ